MSSRVELSSNVSRLLEKSTSAGSFWLWSVSNGDWTLTNELQDEKLAQVSGAMFTVTTHLRRIF
jgi:hypothetical protein